MPTAGRSSPAAQHGTRSAAPAAPARPTLASGGRRSGRPCRPPACAGDVAAIAVAGQQHGLVVLDGHGSPLRPASLWNDTRAAQDAERLTESARGGDLGAADRTAAGRLVHGLQVGLAAADRARGRPGDGGDPAAARLRHRTADRDTARPTAATCPGPAGGRRRPGDTSTRSCRCPEVDLPVGHLPGVVGPAEVAGTVTPVGGRRARAAAGDAGRSREPATTPGRRSGSGLAVGQAAMSLGTSGTIFAVADRPAADPSGIVAGFADATGRFLPLAATLNCTVAVDRVAGWLGLDRDDVEPAGDVVVLPYLDGERTPNLPLVERHDPGPAPHHHAAADPDGRLRGRGRLAAGGVRCDRRGRRRPRSRRRRSCSSAAAPEARRGGRSSAG